VTAHTQPPGLPDLVDEAAETPSWVPWLGFALVVAAAIYAVLGGRPDESSTAAPAHEAAGAEGEPAAPAPGAAAPEAPTPARDPSHAHDPSHVHE
jgi:hypothetical protein